MAEREREREVYVVYISSQDPLADLIVFTTSQLHLKDWILKPEEVYIQLWRKSRFTETVKRTGRLRFDNIKEKL